MDTVLSLLQPNYFRLALGVALIVMSFKLFIKQGIRLLDSETEKMLIFTFTILGACCTFLFEMTNRYSTGFGITTTLIVSSLLTSYLIDSISGAIRNR